MRTSQYLLATQKETPAEAEVISHQLMLRAGMIRKLASGLYTWLPSGLRVLNKVAQIVREEMNKAGAIEVLMPMVQPADLWQETGRWDDYGPELLRLNDRHQRDFVLGPTHEEVITSLMSNEISSYKQLPLNLYQIQTKFRDEVRPRFGIMRGREFTMKDAYSFHLEQDCLQKTYDKMYGAYSAIFTRMDLDFRAVIADSGAIGGSTSHEFHVLAESGEDSIAFSDQSEYAANVEMAATVEIEKSDEPAKELESLSKEAFEQLSPENKIKVTLVAADEESEYQWVAVALRADHTLNPVKAEKVAGVRIPLAIATEADIHTLLGPDVSELGPFDLDVPLVVDYAAAALVNFACANEQRGACNNANWPESIIPADVRSVQIGDPSPDGKGTLQIKRGIEVGHIFQLGDKYSTAMNCGVLNENGKHEILNMGCYGIGVSRIVAAAIEQNHDKHGIIWPDAIAPFKIALIPMNMHKSVRIQEVAEKLYSELMALGIDVLFDDRKERPGVMFNDMELVGIPHTIVIGERNLDNQQVEYKQRRSGEKQLLSIENVVNFVSSL